MNTGCVKVPVKFQALLVSVAKWSHRSLDSSVPIMTATFGKLCKSFEKEDDLFSLTERFALNITQRCLQKECQKCFIFKKLFAYLLSPL